MGFRTQWSGSLARPWRAVCPIPLSLSFRFPTSWLVRSPCSGLLFSESGVHMVASWDQMWFWVMAGVLVSGPGFLDSSLERLSGCDLFRTPAEGGGEPQSSCSRTHTHPLGYFYLDATIVLCPSLHVARSQPPAPQLPHTHHCSQLVWPGATLTPLPAAPRPTGWIFPGSCHSPLSLQ